MGFAAFINVLFLPAPLLFVHKGDDSRWRAGEHKLRIQASRNFIDASFIASFLILFFVGPSGYHWVPSGCCSVPGSRDIVPRCTRPLSNHLYSCSVLACRSCHVSFVLFYFAPHEVRSLRQAQGARGMFGVRVDH